MNIILTGSLGHIGKLLATELVQKRHTVTVISSKSERQAAIEFLGARAAIGSLDDSQFLTTVFAGADAVFAMIPPNFTVPDSAAYYKTIGQSYTQAIGQAGVKRVVHLSSYGADLDRGTGFILGSHYVEEMLNALPDVAVTHLRPGSFYYNLFGFIGMIKERGVISANYGGSDRVVMVHTDDIAAAAAEELVRSASGTDVRYVASDDRTCIETAKVLGAAIGKPELTWVTITDDQMQAGLEKKGMPPHMAASLVELHNSIHSGALRVDYDRHKPVTMGQVKLEDFAREFAAAYQRS